MSKQLRYIAAHWVDSRGCTDRWQRLPDARKAADKPCRMISMGLVIKETKSYIQLAPHVGLESDGDHQVIGVMCIPKVAIIQIKNIKVE